ncbi:MAG: type VI secretion system baseplate subunit TssF [Kiloniellales bacterium]|nr:type VI secretion system baseplate subunit TssF [Kiloniellales bacterium]
MDPRLLEYYSRELQHVREMGAEFAKEYPKIAGRLGLEGLECADPYVERLLEGFAYMAARVRLKVDAEFPSFTQHLLEIVYPHFLAPTPSMVMAQFTPDLAEAMPDEGFLVPRGTVLRSAMGKGDQTSCEYRTAQDVTLWPFELAEVEYLASTAAVSALGVADLGEVKAALRLRLRTTTELGFDKLNLERLPVFLLGADQVPMRLYEQLLADGLGVGLRPAGGTAAWSATLPKTCIQPLGFEESEALLPHGPRSFHGYRLLQEYFAFPARYLMVALSGLDSLEAPPDCKELDILVLLNRSDPVLAEVVDGSNFALFCAPAVNLFPKRTDRVHLSDRYTEHHVVPDRSRPLDFEVYAITSVQGFGPGFEQGEEFLPFYALNDRQSFPEHSAYFTVQRRPRVLSTRQRQRGRRSSYIGSESFISLVDAKEAPYSSDLAQLAISALCTNRDLPLHMPLGVGKTDFTLEIGAPVKAVRCLVGPTPPRPSRVEGETAWQFISHLSLNYLSLVDIDEEQGAAALRDLLGLYAEGGDAAMQKQLDGILSVRSQPIHRRLPAPGVIAFGRGLEVTVKLDEAAFEGSGVFLLGAVLEQFFARYVSLNSFTETVLETEQRGRIMRWPARIGQRHIA